MAEFTRHQLLLAYLRKTYCGGKASQLARTIEKDETYVNRLFYPIGKKGAKGIGPEITTACTEKFKLQRGFWESDPSEWSETRTPSTVDVTESAPASQGMSAAPGQGAVKSFATDAFLGWPFSKRIMPWQYGLLTPKQKEQIEDYVLLQLKTRDPPSEHDVPANRAKSGTHS